MTVPVYSESPEQIPAPEPYVHTFSIVAFDPATKDLGVAVASRYLASGSVVPWAKAGVGAIATQALMKVSFGPNGLILQLEMRFGALFVPTVTVSGICLVATPPA